MKNIRKTKDRKKSGLVLSVTMIILWSAGLVATAGGTRLGMNRGLSAAGVRAWNMDLGSLERGDVEKALEEKREAFSTRSVTLRGVRENKSMTWGELGVMVDVETLADSVMRVGNSGRLWEDLVSRHRARKGFYDFSPGFFLDREKALKRIMALKEKIDKPIREGRLNLRNRKVVPGVTGYRLHVYPSLERVLAAARDARDEIELMIETRSPRITEEMADTLDISTVMGWFETPYHSHGSFVHRVHNLQLSARRLNGTIIKPGEVFSFNETLGPRSQKEGYRVAPVLAAGEKIDGVGGGICQISSTVHAAGFFAGLEIVEAEVHSQPSPYMELGLDAKVVWPDVDVKLRNPYKFPVVIHYEVAFGRVRTEILGKEKPFSIAFERRIVKQSPYREIVRKNQDMPLGQRRIDQRGEFGYHVRRRRVFFNEDGHEIRAQYRTVIYRPTNLIIQLGTRPPDDPDAPPPPELPPVPPRPVPESFVRIRQ